MSSPSPSNGSYFVRLDYDEPPPVTTTTAVSYEIIVPDDDDVPTCFYEAMAEVKRGDLLDGGWDAEDAALIESRRNSPRLPLWMVLYLPRWLTRLCFWVKGLRGRSKNVSDQ